MKKNKIWFWLAVLGIIGAGGLEIVAQKNFVTLDSVQLKGQTIILDLSGPTQFNAFSLDNPQRLVVDLKDTEINVARREISGSGDITQIRLGQFQNEPQKICRMVVDLKNKVPYEITTDGKKIYVQINPAPSGAIPPKVEVVAEPLKEGEEAAILSTATISPTQISQPPKPTTPPVEKKTTVSPKAKTPSGQPSVTEPKKVTALELPKNPVTLNFYEADLRDVFRVLSVKSGFNIIYGDDVSGTLTIHLENVPFDEAFNTILTLKGLVSQVTGTNIIRIMSPQTLAQERSQAVTFTRIFTLNYARADDIKSQLDTVRTAEGRKGSIAVDARSNALIITDTMEGLNSAAALITQLDRKPEQVLIEAKIVEVNLNKLSDLGIDWAYAATADLSGGGKLTTGKTSLVGTGQSSADEQGIGTVSAAQDVRIPQNPASGGTGASFPAAAVQGQLAGISFGLITDNSRLTLMLSMLAQKGLSKILSNPKITTINNQEAQILVGQKVPYTTTTVSPGVGSTQSTEFLSVGIKLTVKPTINADKRITLYVHPEVSLFVRADPAGPVVGTREASTTVLVKDNETIVIGGLIREEDQKLITQVPLLGDIPIIGNLFKRDYNSKDRSELLVFLTPHIIGE